MTLPARILAYRLLLGLAFYLPLEDFVLRWLPLPSVVLLVIRQLPEVLVWSVALGATAMHLMQRGTIRIVGRGIEVYLLAFLAAATATVLLNGGSLFGAAISLKALLRYIPLVYAMLMLAPSAAELDRAPRVVLWAVGLQVAVGLAEWLGGVPARMFFSVLPPGSDGSLLGSTAEAIQEWERYDLTGTMARPIGYAYFIIVGLVVWSVGQVERPGRYWGGVALALLLTTLSHSRMAVLVVVLLVLVHQVSVRGVRQMAAVSLVVLPLAVGVLLGAGSSLADRFFVFDVFTSEYQEHALNTQRLGIIVYILPRALAGGVTLLGYSSDLDVVVPAISAQYDLPPILASVIAIVLEDVYWVALLLYYGLVGLGCFVLFFGKLTLLEGRLARRAPDRRTRDLARIATLLLLLAIPLNAVNQTFEVRVYSYYLWLFAGLALASTLGPAGLAAAERPASAEASRRSGGADP